MTIFVRSSHTVGDVGIKWNPSRWEDGGAFGVEERAALMLAMSMVAVGGDLLVMVLMVMDLG